MAKRKSSKELETKTRRKLAKAQADLRQAQEQRSLAMSRGEQDVERARLRAEQRLAKATMRVERRAGAVTRLEARLHSLAAQASPHTPDGSADGGQP